MDYLTVKLLKNKETLPTFSNKLPTFSPLISFESHAAHHKKGANRKSSIIKTIGMELENWATERTSKEIKSRELTDTAVFSLQLEWSWKIGLQREQV